MKTCPYCAEDIQPEAVKCKHCSSDLVSSPSKATSIIKTYSNDFFGKKAREKDETKMLGAGYRVAQVEIVKKFDGKKTCCLAVIFLPLAFFGSTEKVRVTYEKTI